MGKVKLRRSISDLMSQTRRDSETMAILYAGLFLALWWLPLFLRSFWTYYFLDYWIKQVTGWLSAWTTVDFWAIEALASAILVWYVRSRPRFFRLTVAMAVMVGIQRFVYLEFAIPNIMPGPIGQDQLSVFWSVFAWQVLILVMAWLGSRRINGFSLRRGNIANQEPIRTAK